MPTAPATFVLVPGAGGDPWYWHRVMPLLRSRGHTALAVELPAADDEADLGTYADRIVEATDGHRHVVIVAQSMGGLSAPVACQTLGAEMLVLLNAMVPLPGETGADWWDTTGQPAARKAHAAAQGRPESFDPLVDFLHDLPADVLLEALGRGESRQSDRPFADPFPLSAWPDVETRVLVGRDDRFFPADFQRSIAHARLGLVAEQIPGGHLAALSQPAALAARLHELWRDAGGA